MSILILLLSMAAEEPYDWPLDLPRVITSSFAEYRTGRFHAGIDLRTGGVGPAVHAPRDGYVSRIRCSPWGYGKAVYLKLDDGNTVVFGHLDDFAPALRAYVRRAQHKAKSYTVDLTPAPNAFPVARGEVVAAAGQTGIGVPHLHYEIRDPESRPINPRPLGVDWPDSTPPIIRKILVAPKDPGDTVNGDLIPAILTARAQPDGTFRCDPVSVSGHISFGVDVIDPANNGGSILGIHTIHTSLDGQDLFRTENDRLSYGTMKDGVVAWHPFFLHKGRFLLQWRWPGNDCQSYRFAPGDGWGEAPKAPAFAEIETADLHGNQALVRIPVTPEGPAPAAPEARGSDAPGKVSLECYGEWLVVTAAFPDAEPERPHLILDGAPAVDGKGFRRIDAEIFRAAIAPGPSAAHITIGAEHARLDVAAARIEVFHQGVGGQAALGDVAIRTSPGSPYGTLFTQIQDPGEVPYTPIRPLGKAYRIWPENTPIGAPAKITFPSPEGAEVAERVHVYRKSGDDWSCETTARENGALVINTRRFGTFMAMEDDQPPLLNELAPADEAVTTAVRPAIHGTIADPGSGVASYSITANGRWLLTAYDPESNQMAWEADEDLAPGKYEIEFRVTDRAGNTSATVRRLRITKAR